MDYHSLCNYTPIKEHKASFHLGGIANEVALNISVMF